MHGGVNPNPIDVLAECETGAALCVLASGSSGNCSVLAYKRNGLLRLCLIDLGLSPRMTYKLLADRGLRRDQVDDAIVTHLDADHFRETWLGRSGLPPHARLRMHERHARMVGSRVSGLGFRVETDSESAPETRNPRPETRLRPFSSDFQLDDGLTVHPILMSHDEAGVAAFRFNLSGFGGATLGFCTDLGHVTADLIGHLRERDADGGVDVLAIESNYCPRMQLASSRPVQLKRRIMGGSGHLSNQEALEAIEAVRPREHVLLLHLSRECNDPSLVAGLHAGSDYALTITSQYHPTRWVRVAPSTNRPPAPVVSSRIDRTRTLWTA